MRLHTGAVCTDTVRESALEVDSGRKFFRRTGFRTRVIYQYCAWLFSRRLYQLSYPRRDLLRSSVQVWLRGNGHGGL